MRIVWDEPKRLANLDKHGLDFATLTPEFFLDAVILPAAFKRLKAINLLNGAALTAIFKPLGTEAISVISFRSAARNERRAIK